ncbi:GDSL-type esterase/lipase family protein [Lacibacter sp. H375]|uniref:GDSL-type esterase/lipase family protein n=1 Tax=Lacibacter sp. H375 TaxID=3133424 RepID=UPI0030BB58EF
MQKVIIFVFLISTFIHNGCSNSSKQLAQNKSAVMGSQVIDSLYPSPDLVISYHSDWTRGHYPEMIKEFKKHPLELGDIVFIGNSLTELGGEWGKRFTNPKVKNRGIAGDVTDGVLMRLGELYFYKPTAVFILIGINDIFNESLSDEYIANNNIKIAAAIHKQSPRTKLFIQTILPTSHQRLILKIKAVNDKLKSNAGSETYSLIDLHSFFADENDLIKKDLTNDGVHLTEEGYKLWVNVVASYVN